MSEYSLRLVHFDNVTSKDTRKFISNHSVFLNQTFDDLKEILGFKSSTLPSVTAISELKDVFNIYIKKNLIRAKATFIKSSVEA